MNLLVLSARAYVYCGDWVADCPRHGCGNAEFLYNRARVGSPWTTRKSAYHCSHCGHVAPIDWPERAEEIVSVLGKRPIPHTRNWYPEGHTVAVRAGIPHGQSVRDLIDESAEHGVV